MATIYYFEGLESGNFDISTFNGFTGSSPSINSDTPRSGSYYLSLGSAYSSLPLLNPTFIEDWNITNPLFLRFYFRANTYPVVPFGDPYAEDSITALHFTTDGFGLILRFGSDGLLRLYFEQFWSAVFSHIVSSQLIGTSTDAVNSTWNKIDIAISQPTQLTTNVIVYLNDVEEINYTLDAPYLIQDVFIGDTEKIYNSTGNHDWDDISVADYFIPSNTSVLLSLPSSNGEYLGWIGTYANVDQVLNNTGIYANFGNNDAVYATFGMEPITITNPVLPSSGTNGVETPAWSNPSNVSSTHSSSVANVSLSGTTTTSGNLIATFNANVFDIPTTAIVNGIKIQAQAIAPTNATISATLSFISTTENNTPTLNAMSFTSVVWGSTTDLWGNTVIPPSVLNNQWSVSFVASSTTSGIIEIYDVTATISYSEEINYQILGVKSQLYLQPFTPRDDLVMRLISGSTIDDVILTAGLGPTKQVKLYNNDPNTGKNWTTSNFNSVQFGTGINGTNVGSSDLGEVFCSNIQLHALYATDFFSTGGVVINGGILPSIIFNISVSTGGVLIGGSAYVEHDVPPFVASGGVLIGGSATESLGFAASGGVAIGGSANVGGYDAPPASGGALIGGSLTNFVMIWNPTASGGVVFGGSFSQTYNETASGGTLIGGSDSHFTTYNNPMSGGTLVGGIATVNVTYTQSTSGAILLGGSVTNFVPVYNPSTSGGVVLEGHGAFDDFITASGGVLISGNTSRSLVNTQYPSGGVVVGGAVIETKVIQITPSGGAVIGGSASVIADYNYTATGGVIIGGHAFFIYDEVSTGGAVLNGIATLTMAVATSGGAILGGSAIITYVSANVGITTEYCFANGSLIAIPITYIHPEPKKVRSKYTKLLPYQAILLPAVTVCQLTSENRLKDFS